MFLDPFYLLVCKMQCPIGSYCRCYNKHYSLTESAQGSTPTPEFKERCVLEMGRVYTSLKGQREQSVQMICPVCHLLSLSMVLCHIRIPKVRVFISSLQQFVLFSNLTEILSFFFFFVENKKRHKQNEKS